MAKNRDQLNSISPGGPEHTYSLEEILSEYSAAPQPEDPARQAPPSGENVIPFPESPPGENPLAEGIRRLKLAEREYAGRMFEHEEPDPALLRAEALIPGSDTEDTRPRAERRPRPAPEPAPDLPPAELAALYEKGLVGLRVRALCVTLLALLALGVAAAPLLGLSLPGGLSHVYSLRVYTSAVLLSAAMALGADILSRGLLGLLRGRPGMDALTALACIATLADSLTMLRLGGRGESLPYCAPAALGLAFAMWGTYLRRKGLRQTCRVAAFAATPYLVTLDENKWNGKDAYAKSSAPSHGFGSQIQGEDGARRIFHRAVPLLLLACVLFSMISALGTRRPEHLLWCLSGTLAACASFSGLLCFEIPMSALADRLSISGAALAGWDGVRWPVRGNGLLLTDTDLFPPGTVVLNGIKVFGDFPVDKVVAITASLIKSTGGGLDKVFHDLLRTQGTVYRRVNDFRSHEGGGVSGEIRGEQVLVGTAAFMSLMEINLPPGLGIKNAVFCAVDGELAGIFALQYTLQPSISPSLSALIRNGVCPVLATRDFNLIPSMLQQRFKLPVDKMEFPNFQRRLELSDPRQEHSRVITAVLCREGLGPYSEAVVGARRLRRATRLSAGLACAGSAAGALISFYLTYISAYSSLSAFSLTSFLLLWTIPVFLISGWVNRF